MTITSALVRMADRTCHGQVPGDGAGPGSLAIARARPIKLTNQKSRPKPERRAFTRAAGMSSACSIGP